jgi:hypothetical protein
LDEVKGTLAEDVEKEKKPAPVKSPFTPEELKNMAIVRITTPLSMELMAGELGIDIKLLSKWNPDYELFVYDTYPTKDYALRLPKEKVDNFLLKRELLTKKSKQIFNEMSM